MGCIHFRYKCLSDTFKSHCGMPVCIMTITNVITQRQIVDGIIHTVHDSYSQIMPTKNSIELDLAKSLN